MVKSNNEYDYSAFIGHNSQGQGDIAELNKLVELQHQAEIKVETLEAELKTAKEDLRQIAEKKLPEKMEELGTNSYSTSTGIAVEIKEKIRGSLPKENQGKGYEWLEKSGFGGLIEGQVIVPFGRNEVEAANKFVAELLDKGLVAGFERNVHHSRLDAFIREQLAQGKEVPLEIFNVFRQRIAIVKTNEER